MKKTILASMMVLSSGLFVFAQDLAPNSVKLKVKGSGEKIRYNILPELTQYSDYKSYELKIKDVSGKEYKASTEMTQNAQIKLSLTYIENIRNTQTEGDFIINVVRTHSSLDNISENSYSSGGETPINYYGYQLDHNDKFHVTITDNKGGSGVFYDTTITVLSTTEFPKDYDSQLKIKSKGSVLTYYKKHFAKNTPEVSIESIADAKSKYFDYSFNHTGEVSSGVITPLSKVINKEVRELFEGLFSRSWTNLSPWLFDVKTKEVAYAEINVGRERASEGFSALNENYKNEIYNNFHEESVFVKMEEAYQIFNKYRSDKYVLPLNGDVQEEYKYAMTFNTFVMAFATSRYDEAKQIVEELKVEIRKNPSSGLRRSEAEKIMAVIQPFIPFLHREQRLFETHKELYNYYK